MISYMLQIRAFRSQSIKKRTKEKKKKASVYKVSQPPESKLLSNFLAAILGIPCDNQVLRITSHLA
jgi:hypothetical protein